MGCTKHHENLTIAILVENYPKIIYNMVAFEFANTVANSTEVQGAECKIAPHASWKRVKWLNHYHHATPGEKLPKFHIWHGQFEFGSNFDKSSKNWQGVICKMAIL